MSNQFFPADSHNGPPAEPGHQRHRRMVEPLISLYQDGEASPAERRIVEQYLTVCAECRALYQSFQQVEASLRTYLDAVPEPNLRPEAYPFLQDQTRPDRSTGRPASSRPSVNSGPLRPAYPGLRPSSRLRLPGLSPFAFAGTIAALLLVGMFGLFVLLANSRQPTPQGTETAPMAIGSYSPTATEDTTATATAAPSPAFTPGIIQPVTGNSPTEAATTSTQIGGNPAVTPKPATAAANPAVPATTGVIQKTNPPKTNNPVLPTSTPIRPAGQGGGNPPTSTPNPTTGPATSAATTTTIATTTAAAATATPTSVPPTATPNKPAATPEPAQTTPANNQLVPASPSANPKTTAAATTEPVFSNAPGWIAYVDSSDSWIHLVHADGSDDQLLGDPQAFKSISWEQLVWSTDARWLAAVGLDKIKGQRGIYLLDIQNPRRIELLTEGVEPVWSPDSRFLTYLAPPVSVAGGIYRGRPAFFNLKKRTTVLITSQPETFAPQWFDDSNRILVGQNSIYNLTTNSLTQFKLPFTNDCVGDSLSPSGNKLAVLEQGASGGFETVIYDLNKGQISDPKKPLLRIVPPFQGAIGKVCASERLDWTPDSKYVYYYTSNNPSFSTCLVQATNGYARCLTNVYEPSFTSDGSNLVDFSPSNGIGGLVYSMPSTLSGRPPNLRVIAETRIPPAWQPR